MIAVVFNSGLSAAAANPAEPALAIAKPAESAATEKAIVAANERSVHLVNIMLDKDCKNVTKLMDRISSTFRVQTLKDLSEAYKSLNELYKSGGLTEKEYKGQKSKVLGQ